MMTDNEIIKALKECLTEPCSEQAYINAVRNALNLINRQKAEIEALISGQETLQKYIDKLKEKPNILKPCPFCGGEAEIKPTTIYTEKGICVHCKDCNIHTTTTMYECKYNQYGGKKNVYVTKEMAEERVIEMWNRRTDNAT